jgi:ferredoxin-fold anticodon binding domain-containing protein
MFDIFNYTFIGDTFNIHDDLQKLFDNSNIECEFLLNMGALLRCVDINIIYDFQGYYIKGYNIPKKEYTEYTYKFIGWNQDYTERINSSMSKYITYLRSEAI